jgi:DNA-3-methyladenine glycosylase II
MYQQLAGRAADAIHDRFVKIYGGRFPAPARLLRTPAETLRKVGLSGRKTEYILDLAHRVQYGSIDFVVLASMTDDQVIETLTQVRGIGRWTAEMFLIFCLGRPDVLPVGDLGLRRAMQQVYRLRSLPTPEKMERIAVPWRPYRSVATWYLWKSLNKFETIG